MNGNPHYAFVQKDQASGEDYLVEIDGYPLSGQQVEPTGNRYRIDDDWVRLLAPVIPSKVYGLAFNYRAHAEAIVADNPQIKPQSAEEMTVFMKPSTSVIGPDDPIVLPSYSQNMNFEPELAVVIGRIARRVSQAEALDYVLGYTCVNDVTLRDIQGSDPTWTRAKGFDTSCPLGPWVETELDGAHAGISFQLNGQDVPEARGTTANLIHSIPEQIAFISSFSTLLPGDVIMTGSPSGSGQLHSRDEATVTIDGIGSLRNVVIGEQE